MHSAEIIVTSKDGGKGDFSNVFVGLKLNDIAWRKAAKLAVTVKFAEAFGVLCNVSIMKPVYTPADTFDFQFIHSALHFMRDTFDLFIVG